MATKIDLDNCNTDIQRSWKYYLPSSAATSSSSHVSTKFTRRNSSGLNNNHYMDDIAKRIDASNNYSATYMINKKFIPCRCSFYYKPPYTGQLYNSYTTQGFGVRYAPNGHATFGSNQLAFEDTKLREKFDKKVAALRANPQTLPFVIESKTMAHDIQKIGLSLLDLGLTLASLFSGHVTKRNVKHLVNDAGDLWLAWSFAISPTYDDVRELAGALAEQLEGQPRTVRISVHHATDAQSSVKNAITSPPLGFSGYNTESKYTKRDSSLVAGVTIKASGGRALDALQENFNLTAFVPTLWELLPFSWVVDYFTNASAFLNSEVYSNDKFVYINKCVKTTSKIKIISDLRPTNPTGWIHSVSNQEEEWEYTTFNRTLFTPSALPNVRFRVKELAEISDYFIPKLLNLSSLLKFKI